MEQIIRNRKNVVVSNNIFNANKQNVHLCTSIEFSFRGKEVLYV